MVTQVSYFQFFVIQVASKAKTETYIHIFDYHGVAAVFAKISSDTRFEV